MSKSNVAIGIVVLLVGGAIAAITLKPGLFDRGDDGLVRTMSEAFLEDLRFKDFQNSTKYHHKLDRDRFDIGKAIEQLFLVKPELLDIREQDIVRIDVSDDGRRAKTLTRSRYRRLNVDGDLQEKDLLLYWIKRHPDCPLGARCDAAQGVCVDASGEPIPKKIFDEKSRKSGVSQGPNDGNYEESEDSYSCDATLEDAWFMNLDSTLKQKNYN